MTVEFGENGHFAANLAPETIRVRNSANPCVRDMSKSLRTCQMSVHGYPVDMSIFCNLQLGLLELQEETPQADINQDNVIQCISCWRAARCSWSRSRSPPCSRCCWTIIRGFHTIAGGTEHAVGTRLDAVFPILQRLVHADFAAVEIGFDAQCWSCFSARCWLVGAFSVHIQPQNELRESQTGADVTLSDIRLAVERL